MDFDPTSDELPPMNNRFDPMGDDLPPNTFSMPKARPRSTIQIKKLNNSKTIIMNKYEKIKNKEGNYVINDKYLVQVYDIGRGK